MKEISATTQLCNYLINLQDMAATIDRSTSDISTSSGNTRTDSSLSTQLLSLEQERDSLKEKYEHMRLLMKQYVQENKGQQLNKESIDNLSRLLQESRQEISVLKKRNKSQETVIRTLQSRLTSNGLSGSINLEETDLYVPGTSNQVLDNLVKEVSRLRTLLRGASTDPEEVEKLRKTLKCLEEENQKKETKIETQVKKITELESLLGASENEKDVKISELSNLVRRMQDDFQTRDVLCHSLAEETTNLRQQLHDVAVTCQQMALRLERSEKAQQSSESTSSKTTSSEGPANSSQEELQEKFKEVVLMNKRWQEYDRQRDCYVQELQAIIRSLNEKVKKAEENQVSTERAREIDQALEEAKQRIIDSEADKLRLQNELKYKNEELAQKSREMEQLRSEIEHMRRGSGNLTSDAEIIEALKAQIQICTEDFESERKDREKAQARLVQLEGELEKLKMEYAQKAHLCSESNIQMRQGYRPHQDFYNDFNIPNTHHHQTDMLARGPRGRLGENVADTQIDAPPADDTSAERKPEVYKSVDDKTVSSEKELSSMASLHFPSFSDGDDIEVSANDDGRKSSHEDSNQETYVVESTSLAASQGAVLSCPKCHKEYRAEDHAELIDHVAECCD